MVAANESDALVIRRRFDASPDVVFDLWTKPQSIRKWFRPSPGYSHLLVEVDLRVGGKYRIAFQSPEGRVDTVNGEFERVNRPSELEYTWMWEPPNEHAGTPSRVSVAFGAVEGGTELVLTHWITDSEMRSSHLQGWSGAIDQIAAALAE